MIEIQVNGKAWKLHPESTVSDLLSRLKLSPKACAVEKNGEILERKDYSRDLLKAGDRVEIIRMMAGG
jgi:sulfur carrier protein